MNYGSCFTGVGGLEGSQEPSSICEIDPECREVLRKRFPNATQYTDVRTLPNLTVDALVGGWPCQDLSVAGKMQGLKGENSGLFYAFIDAAVRSNCSTIIAENVPNLLRLERGEVFLEVLMEFKRKGFNYCSWRTLNARQFGLPHNRNRVFIVATKYPTKHLNIFRRVPEITRSKKVVKAAGFYWTAGTHSICYSDGYVPAIKVGSTLSIPSPPAIHHGEVVRLLSPDEALRLQGFNPDDFRDIASSSKYRMAGNAVARPVGRFVVDSILDWEGQPNVKLNPSQADLFGNVIPLTGFPESGIFDGAEISGAELPRTTHLADNLNDFLDPQGRTQLSKRAAQGLLSRLERSGGACPQDVRNILLRLANEDKIDA